METHKLSRIGYFLLHFTIDVRIEGDNTMSIYGFNSDSEQQVLKVQLG